MYYLLWRLGTKRKEDTSRKGKSNHFLFSLSLLCRAGIFYDYLLLLKVALYRFKVSVFAVRPLLGQSKVRHDIVDNAVTSACIIIVTCIYKTVFLFSVQFISLLIFYSSTMYEA